MGTDRFSKWIEEFPVSNERAFTVAEILINEVISRHGVSLEIHSYKGREFDFKILKNDRQLLGIHNKTTTPLYLQSNGQVKITSKHFKLLK